MGLEVKIDMGDQIKHGLWGSNMKTGKIFTQGLTEANFLYFFGSCTFWGPEVIRLCVINQFEYFENGKI